MNDTIVIFFFNEILLQSITTTEITSEFNYLFYIIISTGVNGSIIKNNARSKQISLLLAVL